MIISYSVMDGFTLQACSSHYKHLHGQQHKRFHVLRLESISQANMTSNSALCYESFKWKIHTMLYMTHWNIITLLTKLEAIECYHIPPMILASAWIWTRLESTKILPTSPASARILKGFGRISSSLKATMSFVYYIWQQVMLYLITYKIRQWPNTHAYTSGVFSRSVIPWQQIIHQCR